MIIKQILKDWGLEMLILSFFIVVIIPYGAGITFDTVSFFQAGDNFWSSGKYVHYAPNGGLEFAAHRFPLYPLLVSLFKSIDPDLLALQIILFVALIAGLKFFLKDLKAPKYFLLLLATYPVFLNLFAIWTESLYAVLFVWLLIRLNKEQQYQKAIWVILIVILLCLTRMVGIVVVGSLLIAYLIDKRPQRGVLLFVSGAAVISIWTMLGSYFLGDTARSIQFIGFNFYDLIYLTAEFGRWITPFFGYSLIPLVVGFALFLVPIFFAAKAWKNRHEVGVLFWFLIIHFYSYTVFIIASKIMLDASIAFDARTLFPLMINFIGILIMIQTANVLNKKSREKVRFIFPKIIAVVVFLNVFSIWGLRLEGVGYNSKEWKEFAFVPVLNEIENELTYTNDQAALYLYAGNVKNPVLLPQKMDLYSQQKNETYQEQMDVMLYDLNTSEGIVVWVRNGITGDVYPSYDELKESQDLEIVYDDWLCLILKPI